MNDLGWIEVLALIISGTLVGFINTLAGGGTVISLSLFLFLGLPIGVANGTNRIAIVMQNLMSAGMFRRQKILDLRKASWLALPAVIGSLLGAQIAAEVNKTVIERAFAVILLLMIFFMLVKPSAYLHGDKTRQERPVSYVQIFIFFLIGIYGGFIQVGVGYFLLAALVLGAGFDLVKANAIKVWIVLLYSPFALAVFIYNGDVNWTFGLIHGLGNIIGAYIASGMAVSKGVNFVKWVIIAVIIITSAQLFGLYDFNEVIGLLLPQRR